MPIYLEQIPILHQLLLNRIRAAVARIEEPLQFEALLMSRYIQPLNLQISPHSLNQGEYAIRQELALQLYAQNIFTFAQARQLANLSVWEFQQLLGQQKIERHYNEIDLAEDIKIIESGF